jgi:His/Glu/Gln/Arg/opine family amino acid ABC transporter permease subunit
MASASATPPPSILQRLLSVVTDLRFLRVVGQAVFLVLIVFVLVRLWGSISSALEANDLTPNLDFMENRAGFEIGGVEDYTPDDSYWDAFAVGLRNSLSIIVVGLAGATVLGIVGGIFLLSSNWLVRSITRGVVEILRNTPLLVQIFVMYFVVILALPPLRESVTLPADGINVLSWSILLYLGAALVIWLVIRRRSGDERAAVWMGLVGFIIATTAVNALAGSQPDLWGALRGLGDLSDGRLWLFLLIAGMGALGAWFAPAQVRAALLGLIAGIVLGGLAFFFGVLPQGGLRFQTEPILFLNNRGMTYPEVHTTPRFAEWFAFVALGLGLGSGLWLYLRRQTEATGTPYPRTRYALLVLIGFAVLGWFVVSAQPMSQMVLVSQDGTLVQMPADQALAQGLISPEQARLYSGMPVEVVLPQRQGLRFGTGETLSAQYVALLLALVIYTAAFIAEIVRAGILAVPRGQLEASRALGLSYSQLLRLVILPQALRVIIPPLTNQYLNLAKNSSLAIAISFADVYQVMNTVGNQSGQSVSSIVLVMVTYLVISLVISAVMNWVNGRFQLVTR